MTYLKSLTPVNMVLALATTLALAVAVTALIVGAALASVIAVSLGCLGFGWAMARSQPKLAPIGAAVALMGQAIAFTTAFQGHPWQLDSHMLFFALLACLTGLRSIAALLVATAIVALHHVSLSVLMPSLIYPPGAFMENLARTKFHAVILVVETIALAATVHHLNRVAREMQAQTKALEASLQDADAAQRQALASKELAETAQHDAVEAQTAAEAALEQARDAQEVRRLAEKEKQMADDARRAADAAKAREQADVVDRLRFALTRLEGGDLTIRITQAFPAEYETLRSEFNAAMQTLEDMVSVVAQRSEQMEAEVREI
ncbi:MAG: hypothetical protein AAFZ14_02875, partial [Pseudomonadota bacterium]